MNKIKELWKRHGKIMLLTFEIFWLCIFLLDRVSTGGGGEVPQFVYVNF